MYMYIYRNYYIIYVMYIEITIHADFKIHPHPPWKFSIMLCEYCKDCTSFIFFAPKLRSTCHNLSMKGAEDC